ncbi:MAG: DUF1559 domain-containing protein [Planctomycetales bacterium]|nr:DUF1559 domain-containing protein [Planctomycetales bacterium]
MVFSRKNAVLRRSGFTLIELLVVMIIIALLVGLLLPAVQRARAAARRTASTNKLKQIALGVANFEAANSHFPPSWQAPETAQGDNLNGWSIHALLLPHLEQSVIFNELDFRQPYSDAPAVVTADGTSQLLTSLRVDTYVSPNEPRDEPRIENGVPANYPLSYAANLGTWFVWDPASRQGGDGAFYPNSNLRASSFTDGLSNTLCFAEVKAWNPYYRNANVSDATLASSPPTDIDVCSMGGDFKENSGHTEWVDGRAHQIGFTTVFRPNAKVLCSESNVEFDVDWTNWQEGKGLAASPPVLNKTYAAVTARSRHGGGVLVSMMDGSVRWVDDTINLGVWRAMSTRGGGEFMPSDDKL